MKLPSSHRRAGAAAAALLAFAPAGRADTQQTPALDRGETWWHAASYNAVLALWPCPEKTLCARVVWHAPQDRRLADILHPPARRGGPAADVCNYRLQAEFNRVDSNNWAGRLTVPARNNRVVSLRVEARTPEEIRIIAGSGLFRRAETLTQVPRGDARYSQCRPVRS